MGINLRRWSALLLLVILPATQLAQACEVRCGLSRISDSLVQQTHQQTTGSAYNQSAMTKVDATQPTNATNDAGDKCPMAALCDLAHLSVLPTIFFFGHINVLPTQSLVLMSERFTSTSFPPEHRPPAV